MLRKTVHTYSMVKNGVALLFSPRLKSIRECWVNTNKLTVTVTIDDDLQEY